MSNPINPLSQYRSYSYYHVLAICDSSDTATQLAGSTTIDAWQHPIGANSTTGNDSILGIYAPKNINTAGGTGQYCIMVNGSTDAAFTITKATWSSFTAASATMNDRGTSIALEGVINLSEPRGIMFLDQVVRCCIELGVDSASAFWVLKTFFVGYTYDVGTGADGIGNITDTPPVIFLAYDVSATFGVTGGEYEISFVAAANGASRLPHFSKASKALNFKAGDTFDNTLTALQGEITKNYKHYFDCVRAQVGTIVGSEDLVKSLREVNYVITCGAPYAGNSTYIVNDQSSQLKDMADCSSPANIHVSAGVSIEDAIHRIIGMCPAIKQEADVGIGGVKYTTKIHSWVTSTAIGTGADKQLSYTVGYRVDRQVQPHSISFDVAANIADVGNNATMGANLIEYNYIYTGKNIDILEFDIKMNMGMVYLQAMTIANPYRQPNQPVHVSGTTVAGLDILTRQNGQNIPVFFGTNIKTSSIKDAQDTKQQSQFSYSMSKHASLESIEATVKITGNPALLGSINQTSDPVFVSNEVAPPFQDDGFARYSEWSLSPCFAKLNIMMPRNNDDISLFTGSQTSQDSNNQSNDYAVPFWFTGYYYIYGIEHVFDNGEFYQNLQALGIPEKNAFKQTQDTTSDRDVTIEIMVKECYDNDIGCGSPSSTNTTVAVVPEQHDSVNSPSTAIATYAANSDLSNIAGYDSASSQVKAAIHNAAINNPTISKADLALTISYESNFQAGVINSAGYQGLGQFGTAAWQQFGNGDPLDPQANANATAKFMAYNTVQFNKNVSSQAPSVVDLYTMHQQGTGGGTKILQQVYNGTGDAPGSAGLSAKNLAANGLPANASANQVYNSFSNSLGKRLKSGPLVAASKQTTNPPTSSNITETAPVNMIKAKDALAAHRNCMDNTKQQQDPAKFSTCSKVPNSTTDTTVISSANTPTVTTGQTNSKSPQLLVTNVTGELISMAQAAEIPIPK